MTLQIGLHSEVHRRRETAHQLARLSLFGFLMTFILARACVFLIMSKAIPNLYFFAGGTHVHHLNYGIFLLSVVSGYSVFCRPTGRKATITALLYGVAMGLTFDEFGMWLNLGGSYWQRASVDAVIVVSAFMALVGFASTLKRFESHHFWLFIALMIAMVVFGTVIYVAGRHLGDVMGEPLHKLELQSSP